MQAENQSTLAFCARTEKLAAVHGVSLRKLADIVGISQAMLFAYRSEKEPISKKAWHKIRAAEIAAGIAAADPKAGLQEALDAAPDEVRNRFVGPTFAWQHYLEIEAVLDELLAQRGGRKLTAQEEREFSDTLRAFLSRRPRGRAALLSAVQLAEKIGSQVLEQHLGESHPPAAGARNLAEIMDRGRPAEQERRKA